MNALMKSPIKLPRGKAMVAAAVAGVATLLIGSAVLVIGATGGSGSVLSAASDTNPTTVVTQVQYDDSYSIVDDPSSAATGSESAGRASVAPGATAAPAPQTPAPTAMPTSRGEDPTTAPEPGDEPTTTKPAPTTTVPAPTPTTRPADHLVYPKDLPPGWEIPEDWPANKPLPPIPAGCRQGHLEDNLVWNCEH